ERALHELAHERRRRRRVPGDSHSRKAVVTRQPQGAGGERLHVLPEIPRGKAGAPIHDERPLRMPLRQGDVVLALERLFLVAVAASSAVRWCCASRGCLPPWPPTARAS